MFFYLSKLLFRVSFNFKVVLHVIKITQSAVTKLLTHLLIYHQHVSVHVKWNLHSSVLKLNQFTPEIWEKNQSSNQYNSLNTEMRAMDCRSNSLGGADCRESILMSFAPSGTQATNFPRPELKEREGIPLYISSYNISAKRESTKEYHH